MQNCIFRTGNTRNENSKAVLTEIAPDLALAVNVKSEESGAMHIVVSRHHQLGDSDLHLSHVFIVQVQPGRRIEFRYHDHV